MSRMISAGRRLLMLTIAFGAAQVLAWEAAGARADESFDAAAQILGRRCLGCHSEIESKGGLSLETRQRALEGGDSGPSIVPGDVDSSWLLDMVSGDTPDMPKASDPLTAEQVETIRSWIASGAPWPEGKRIEEPVVANYDWWSLRPLEPVPLPELTPEDQAWVRTPVDAYVLAKMRQQGLSPSPPADRRTLIRRVYFDLIGLPPPPEKVQAFLEDNDPLAYERMVDDLLASPHYGERWARHWLDVVHYGDTHGYDKDKPRPNAWPYRDYVIRSFNQDKPYERFVREQIAGDVLWPHTRDGNEATGFIAAGPWDFIGHAEVSEDKLDGMVARNLDRDDMVTSTLNTFVSTTIQCARCHNHKFDPITQQHYYSLQAVFAALDRADLSYDLDPDVSRTRLALNQRKTELTERRTAWFQRLEEMGGEPLAAIEAQIKRLERRQAGDERPEFGYHSQIEPAATHTKWVQLDLGQSREVAQIVLVGAYDDYNGIGAGFGFPARYKVELSDDPAFQSGVTMVTDHTQADVPNPGVEPQLIPVAGVTGRYVRITATQLALRSNDYIFALAEAQVLSPDGTNLASGANVTALDSIEAPPRWRRENLVDGVYPGAMEAAGAAQELTQAQRLREQLLDEILDDSMRADRVVWETGLQDVENQLEQLPPQAEVYAGMVHTGSGTFKGRGHVGGKPREIRVLHRGEVSSPGEVVGPGTIPIIEGVDPAFALTDDTHEGMRRVALANWLVRRDNPLTWRSIVNRIWLYHFGNGIVASANDFGRMGEKPTHPELLDWLALEFRDGGQSIKALHRLMVNSSTYRQSSQGNPEFDAIDSGNRYLWRMNRRGLEAEVVRDSVLVVSGKMDLKMYGPAFRDFVMERPEHSPHYLYHKHDPDDVTTHRRSIYRFLVRSQQQPFMQTLDCADPSQSVAKRDTTVTAIQALTMLNNKFMVRMSEHFAARVASEAETTGKRIDRAYQLALGRLPTAQERRELKAFASEHGLANTCRVILNLNEFMFVD